MGKNLESHQLVLLFSEAKGTIGEQAFAGHQRLDRESTEGVGEEEIVCLGQVALEMPIRHQVQT